MLPSVLPDLRQKRLCAKQSSNGFLYPCLATIIGKSNIGLGMNWKQAVKKSPTIVGGHRKYLSFQRNLKQLGLFPLSPTKFANISRYLDERKTFSNMGGLITHSYPILSDYQDSAGTARGHYFHQDLLVSQFIFQSNPNRHIDIGSRIDGFVAHVAAFREIEIFDIRELCISDHPNIVYHKANLMLGAGTSITDSLSCLHTIEHFGLGRYGDPINPEGHIIGFNNLIEMLRPGGVLYISFPVGTANEVHFNAHRVFHPSDIFSWAPNRVHLLRFDYVDDFGDLHKNVDILDEVPDVTFGCGIYTFRKK